MADNVLASGGQLYVATKQDNTGVQHQEVVPEFLSGGKEPIQIATIAPLPTEDPTMLLVLQSLLVEQRITNQLLYAWINTEVEPLESLRAQYKDWPITP